ncbi:hypothetical protein QTA57_01390 [Fontisubflavum oceani]|uniref:hypothetical protein n=1 Tax=Fontisubflavum oceani TaxID=2978973 RepID=UPI0025B47AAE|nr:hypothetical protein [Fontisubflavum oceani]WJY21880.1 hypothetical protein QTA57_01390 [Fontisubflavum oceani]
MSHQIQLFNHRVNRIERNYANRIPETFTINEDGLVVPRTRRRLRFRFPFRALISGLVCAFLVKGFLIYHLGQEDYTSRIDRMLTGSTVDQAAARVLLPDQASLWVSEQYAVLVTFIRQP